MYSGCRLLMWFTSVSCYTFFLMTYNGLLIQIVTWMESYLICTHTTCYIYIRACLYRVRNKTVFIHSFDVFELFILPFAEGLSVYSFPPCSVFYCFAFLVSFTSLFYTKELIACKLNIYQRHQDYSLVRLMHVSST